MTDFSSRLAYSSVTRPVALASTVRKIEKTGVMPLPPANSKKSPSSERGAKMPDGDMTSMTSPALTWSHTQLEPRPSRTRLMVTRGDASKPGALDME